MKTTPHSFFRATVAGMALLLSLFPMAPDASGAVPVNNATWTPGSEGGQDIWNNNGNWDTATAPNGTLDQATFNNSTVTTIFLTNATTVDRITFGVGGDAFTINTNGSNLTFSGLGIVNNSGQTQTIINGGDVDPDINFNNSSTAGNAVILNVGDFNRVFFNDSSTAGSAQITNSGFASSTQFFGASSAGSATIINQGENSFVYFGEAVIDNPTAANATIFNVGDNSFVEFANNANGALATIVNVNPTSFVDISGLSGPGTTLGAIAGGGSIFLGSKNLTVGGNNLSTVFSGVITDGESEREEGFEALAEGPTPGGSLTKVGTGVLTLTGINTYTGNTIINGGSLIVDGSIASPTTMVNVGGLLGGHGLIGGSVINNGTVSPGNSPGTLRVQGNYTQGSTGNLVIQIAATNSFDKLLIAGAANLNGTLVVQSIDGFKLQHCETYQFLTATGGVNGKFANFVPPETGTILKFGLVYEPNDVLLKAEFGSFTDTLRDLTPNQASVANALDHIVKGGDGCQFLGFLSTEPLGNLPADLDKIAAEEYTSIFTLGTAFDNVQAINLQRRVDDIRSGSNTSGFHTTGGGSFFTGSFGLAGPTGNGGKEMKESKGVTPVAENRWGVFLTGMGEWVGVQDDFNARGYDIATGGFSLGVDYKVCPNFAVGLMAGYVGTGVDLTDGGRVFVNGGKLGLYATAFGNGLYADAAVTGGYSSYDLRRSALQGTARGSTDGGDLNVLFGTGYDVKMGGFTFGPTASFNYTYVGMDGFTERGSQFPLRIPSQGEESIRSAFGIKASYDCKVGSAIVKPELRAAWQHEFGDRTYTLDSSFAGGASGNFSVAGPTIGRDSLLVGAGFAVMFNDHCSTYLYYDGELGRTRYDAHNVSGGLRVAF